MTKDIVLDNEFAEASYIPEYKIAHMVWKKSVIPSEEYRNALIKLLDYCENKKAVSYVSDGRLSGPVEPQDRKWFQEYAIVRAEKIGLKHSAVIIKNDPFRKFYMNGIMKVATLVASYNIKIFTNYDEAIKWVIDYNDYND